MPLPRIIIEKPPSVVPRYGILSAALVLDPTDPHAAAGFQYQPDYCGPAHETLAACYTSPGELEVNVSDSALATLTGTVPDTGTYTVNWGDGHTDTNQDADDVDGLTRQYAAPGNYTVTVTGGEQSRFTADPVQVTVTAGDETGPFTITFEYVSPKAVVNGRPLVTSTDFTLYTMTECRLVGASSPEQYAEDALRRGEGPAIGTALATAMAGDPDLIIVDTDDLGFGSVHSLAVLEQALAENYTGEGVIHMDKATATHLAAACVIQADGPLMRTKLGTRVSVEAGYADAIPEGEDAGTRWLWATGTVVVQRSPIFTSPQTFSTDPATNDFEVLSERPVSVGWECVTVAVQVDLSTSDSGNGNGDVDGGTP